MNVVECEIPSQSALASGPAAYFQDAWRAPLSKDALGVVDIFQAVFGHRLLWMKLVLVARNWAVKPFGLKTATAHEIFTPPVLQGYSVGDKIGSWPIFELSAKELVAGRDNSHLDFRVSILKILIPSPAVVISTVCHVHNPGGKAYLRVIKPFHRVGVRLLLRNAVRNGRL